MKRLFVISLGWRHAAIVALLLASLLALAVWPRPGGGGEAAETALVIPNGQESVAAMSRNAFTPQPARLAIIIDDFGEGREGVRQMMAIPRHLTFAVMPFCTYTKADAEDGWRKGYEIIVHLPMEPVHGRPEWLGSNPILCSQDSAKITSIAQAALADVPHAKGANVHMGSKASADSRVMRCVLGEVARAGLYFVDSRTGAKSVIEQVAAELHVPCLGRNVFLDGQKPKSHIIGQLRQAEEIALKTGYAVAIGHVGIEGGKPTAEAITELLGEFDSKGVQLVYVSELFGDTTPEGPQGD